MTPNAAALAVAREWIGTPYLDGQACKGVGADCLGLIRGVYAEAAGVPVPPAPARPQPWPDPLAVEAALVEVLTLRLTARLLSAEDGDVAMLRVRYGAPATHLGVVDGPRFINAWSRRAVARHHLPRGWQVVRAWSWAGVFEV